MVWTDSEIREYKPRMYERVQEIYEIAGIPTSNPEERAKYLAEEVLQLTMLDHEALMRKAHKEGRAATLNLLEDMAVAIDVEVEEIL